MAEISDFFFALRFFVLHSLQQKRRLKKWVKPLTKGYKIKNDGSLGDTDFKKIEYYYGLLIPAFLGGMMEILQEKKLDSTEAKALTYQAAMTGLFDDFTDVKRLSSNVLHQIINNPEHHPVKDNNEQLFLWFYLGVLRTTNPTAIKEALNRIHSAQIDSQRQEEEDLPIDFLKQVTHQKGAASIVFYRLALNAPLPLKEEEFYNQLGGWLQLGNDIFDVYKDSKEGIHTLLTDWQSIEKVKNYFDSEYHKVVELGRIFGSNQTYRRFLLILDIVFRSRVLICLEQLHKMEQKELFHPSNLSRSQLVCDMERPGNLWKSLTWSWREHKKRVE